MPNDPMTTKPPAEQKPTTQRGKMVESAFSDFLTLMDDFWYRTGKDEEAFREMENKIIKEIKFYRKVTVL